ncbi:porin family protein [Lutibacter sp.]|uniref:porin family protein n=1 Tax=Lutibacter sp. TaxID=1925666 RepID=UPI0035650524
MGKQWIIIIFFFLFNNLNAQVNKDTLDLRYLEDQIYLSLTYNILINKPSMIAQHGFSGGVSIGFIKDIPFNENRNFGLGIGLGYVYNSYTQNLKISKENQITVFEAAQDYNTNRFGINALEIPIEIRWRNSTPQKYKFWRIYGGIKLAYVVSANTIYKDAVENLSTKNISEFNKIQYGLTLATGFSTWNLYVYYGLNPIFKSVDFNDEKLGLKDLNVGLKFYIM